MWVFGEGKGEAEEEREAYWLDKPPPTARFEPREMTPHRSRTQNRIWGLLDFLIGKCFLGHDLETTVSRKNV